MEKLHQICLYLGSWALLGVCACTHHASDDGSFPPVLTRTVAKSLESPDDQFVAGDNLEMFVKEDETLNGTYRVREGGYIVVPRAGRISVSGLSRSAAERQVKNALQSTQLTEATVLTVVAVSSAASTISAVRGF